MAPQSGIGYDVHPLIAGRSLVLGGVSIPFDKGLAGHSDGDVLIHAIIDALLGAATLGDIGTHFSSSDPQYKEIASTLLLRRTSELLEERGWRIIHLDATIVAEQPTMKPFIDKMRRNVAESLKVDRNSVNIKATTTDGLGSIGRGEGIAAQAIATIEAKG